MRFTDFMRSLAFSGMMATLGLTACGGPAQSRIDGTLEAPAAREAKVALTPSFDVSSLYDPSIADRVIVDDVEVNIADVRLLGADPSIPSGGLSLLSQS